jgi:hypothetical protein
MHESRQNDSALTAVTKAQPETATIPIDPDAVSGGCGDSSGCARSIAGGAIAGSAGGVVGVATGVLAGAVAGCDGPGMFSTGSGNIGGDVIGA